MTLKIEVIAIGDEILTGFTINSNAAFIGQALLSIGLRVSSQRTLSDNPDLLTAGLQQSHKNYDLTICTGGLGPTCDDLTRQSIARAFKCELKFVPEIEQHLIQRYGDRKVSIVDQATIPSKAEYILNEVGTACALIFNQDNKMMIFLPGIPTELQHFMRINILPMLQQKYNNAIHELHQQCNFIQVTESQVDPVLRKLANEYPKAKFGIYPNLGIISVHIISHFKTREENLMYQQPIKDILIAAFKDNFFSDTTNDLATVVCNLGIAKNLRINILQTSPDLNLSSNFAPILQYCQYTQTSRNVDKILNDLLNDTECNLALAVTGVPSMLEDEQLYSAELEIAIQIRSQSPVIKVHSVRGNKNMLSTRALHLVLAEVFRVIVKYAD